MFTVWCVVRKCLVWANCMYLFEALTANDPWIPYWMLNLNLGLGGNKNFGGLLFVLGSCCNLLYDSLADVFPNVTLFSMTTHKYALCAAVLLIFLGRFTIGFYLFSTPERFLFRFSWIWSIFRLFDSTFSASNASIGFSWSFFKFLGRVASPWFVVFNSLWFTFQCLTY